MFNRITLKSRAKMVLSLHYWPTFLAIFLAGLITQAASFLIQIPIMPFSLSMDSEIFSATQLIVLGVLFLMIIILSIALTVFVGGPLLVGVKRFLLDTALDNKSDISSIFYGFKNGYKSIATASLMKNLILIGIGLLFVLIAYILVFILIGILSLLFGNNALQNGIATPLILLLVYSSFIPYMMKTYDYYLTDYILAENPDMQWRDVLKKSKEMMRGNRWSTFVMHLSFIGWILLGLCACGVGVMFVDPYIQATDTQLYLELSGKNETQSESYTVDL